VTTLCHPSGPGGPVTTTGAPGGEANKDAKDQGPVIDAEVVDEKKK